MNDEIQCVECGRMFRRHKAGYKRCRQCREARAASQPPRTRKLYSPEELEAMRIPLVEGQTYTYAGAAHAWGTDLPTALRRMNLLVRFGHVQAFGGGVFGAFRVLTEKERSEV